MSENHEKYIRRCFELAEKGRGLTSPNPLVGSVVVRDGKVISEGYHQRYGENHAERNALLNIDSVEGATLYCNLEPCCHTNKQTPPCADLIIEKKISRVVIANVDPNPNVAGKGIEKLKSVGIEVVSGILEEEGEELNKIFFHYMRTGLPWIHLKIAQTLDGKMMTLSGDSKWITSRESRKQVHELRFLYDAVMVGKNTALNDNPKLNIRHIESFGKDPFKIIAGSKMGCEKIELFSHEKTIFVSTKSSADIEGKDLKEVFFELGKRKISSILVEGGPNLLSQFLEQDLWNQITVFQAPKAIGKGNGFLGSVNEAKMSDAKEFRFKSATVVDGGDLRIEIERPTKAGLKSS